MRANLGNRSFASILALALALSAAGCRERVYLPEGDPEAGREAFLRHGCDDCHRVVGEDFEPTAENAVPFKLANPADPKSREYIAESIIAPSHRFARPPAVPLSADPPIMAERPEYRNIRRDGESRMLDFRDTLTVRELLDLASYLREKRKR